MPIPDSRRGAGRCFPTPALPIGVWTSVSLLGFSQKETKNIQGRHALVSAKYSIYRSTGTEIQQVSRAREAWWDNCNPQGALPIDLPYTYPQFRRCSMCMVGRCAPCAACDVR